MPDSASDLRVGVAALPDAAGLVAEVRAHARGVRHEVAVLAGAAHCAAGVRIGSGLVEVARRLEVLAAALGEVAPPR